LGGQSGLFELQSPSQTEFIVRVDYKLDALGVQRSTVRSELDLGRCVWNMADAHHYFHGLRIVFFGPFWQATACDWQKYGTLAVFLPTL
jgi:hypothetical protein